LGLEDDLLKVYWHIKGGLIYKEVPIGAISIYDGWSDGSKTRRIDGVRIVDDSSKNKIYEQGEYEQQDFYDSVKNKVVEIIEIKEKLSRYVFGQTVAGRDMFEEQFESSNVVISTILCMKGDPAMEWVCEKHGVEVNIISIT
jgi:malate/lactate dehydrogenase